ncbi:PQQ-like beta-propeller repeat protein [Aquihabitans sp. G128]|uniref:outer membrane protein assembly factor BamB family protein n=1 Tax=Aquihabitans sp. G128 TaxID=2849779 RepID=UPI001C22EC4B|nr:PQQ-binding-like beta-propeller repeat protein [Aquihabitans sp. G128]QXC59405.1 PQQ-like beta-propeller repeat protein [Aquihabitans sp. G128]
MTGASFGAVGGAGAIWMVDDAATLWRLGPPRTTPVAGRTWVRHVGELREEPAVQFATADGDGGVLVVDRSSVSSLDPETGVQAPIAALPPKLGTVEAAMVVDDLLVLTTADEIVALGARDGRLRWRTPHGKSANVSPVVFGSALAFRSQGPSSELLLVSIRDGAVLGRIPTGSDAVGAPPVVCRGALVVPAGGGSLLVVSPGGSSAVASGFAPDVRSLGCDERRGRVWAVGIDGDHAVATWADAATGAVAGTVGLGPREVGPWDAVQVVGDTVVVPTLVAGIVGLDADTGAQRWSRPPGLLRGVRAVVIDGDVWIVDRTGRTEVLDARSGRVRWTERGLGEDLSAYNLLLAPVVAGHRVVLASPRALWALPLEGPR